MTQLIGRIERPAEPGGIDFEKWKALIDAHPSLGREKPLTGINPFTRQPTEFKPNALTGIIRTNGGDIGSIYTAMDGSLFLIVDGETDSIQAVMSVAKDVASSLGGQFIWDPEPAE